MSPLHDSVLLYDGVCALCNGIVRFVLARDSHGTMRFAALDSEFAEGVRQRHPPLRAIDSVALVFREDGEEVVLVRSAAIIAVAAYVGGPWRAAVALRIVPRILRDWGYSLIARVRYRTFGRYDSCPVPAAGVRGRFLG